MGATLPGVALPPPARKELYSYAYMAAIAASAQCELLVPKMDYNSLDAQVLSTAGKCPQLGVQLKATAQRCIRDGHVARDSTKNFSAWWGMNGCNLVDTQAIQAVDLGIGRLDPFDPAWVATYPMFKDPSKNFDHAGVSLCKIGFPFNAISPTWNNATKGFDLPIGDGLPLYPIEGILARHVIIDPSSIPPPAPTWPLRFIETSSPGLRGQSGGPSFDIDGTVWAIQVKTISYALGFDIPQAKGEQYFHAGLGVSVATILPVLDSLKINYRMSAN